MSGGTVTLPYVRTNLAGGLAKCTTAPQRHEEDGPVLSTTGSQYSLPIAETKRRLPIRPPQPASVMHRSSDLCFPKISHSHAVHAAPSSTQRRISASLQSAASMNATHFHISADKRLETCNTTTRENFQPAQRVTPAVMVRKRAPEAASKFTPCSGCDDWSPTYSSTYRPHSSGLTTCHAARRKRYLVTKNAGCCPITGRSVTCCTEQERVSSEMTTNCATYRSYKIQDSGYRSDPHPRHQQVSSIPHGDPDKVAQPSTTNRVTFQPPQPTTGSVYSRSAAVSATLASSVHFGGTPKIDTFSTTVRDTFPCPVGQAGRKEQGNIERIPRNASFLPRGDLDAGRVKERISLSTTGTTHGMPPPHSYPAHVDSSRLHTASSIYFGCQQQPLVPNSTMATSYLPLTARTHRVGAPVRDNVPLNYYPGHLCGSTAASSYRTHTGDLRHNLAPTTLRNVTTEELPLAAVQLMANMGLQHNHITVHTY